MSFREHAVSALLMLAVSCALTLSATSRYRPTPSDPVLARLAKVSYFAFGGVGFGSATSQGEIDYRAILSRTSAPVDFEKLFAIGNPQAKSYALVGIKQLNPSRFETLATAFEVSKPPVSVMSGCIIFPYSAAEVVRRIRSGLYSGPQTHDLIPPVSAPQPRTANAPESWMKRLMKLFSAPPLPDPPAPPPGPPPPPARSASH